MASKARHEGYLMIDNRNSPGVPQELIDAANRAGKNVAGFSGSNLFESATVTCSHCGAVVVLNPDRKRPRHYCSRCDHYVCDNPACGLECNPFKKQLDILHALAGKPE